MILVQPAYLESLDRLYVTSIYTASTSHSYILCETNAFNHYLLMYVKRKTASMEGPSPLRTLDDATAV